MTIPEILKELELYTGRFPMAAMQAAVEQQEAITPELLRALEEVAQDPAKYAKRSDYMLHLFAMHLLAQFREKRTYAPLIKIFSAPPDIPYELAGDTVTDGLSRILASVWDGDLAPVKALIENVEVDEFVRNAGIDTFLVLEHSGQISRDEVIGYFRDLFQGRLKREPSFAWDGLVSAVADLTAPELLDDVRKAYADGLLDPSVAGLKDIERDLAAPEEMRARRAGIIQDAIAEMRWWAAFVPEESNDLQSKLPKIPASPSMAPTPPSGEVVPQAFASKPFVREPKIGRNDPCPCGSGKKYKKCCGK